MTRFARAKGSKASNERVPNEATPWHVMKQQILDNSSKEEENKGKKSAKELLEEAEARDSTGVTEKVSSNWAQFESEDTKKGAETKMLKPQYQKIESTKRTAKTKKSVKVATKSAKSSEDDGVSKTPAKSEEECGKDEESSSVETMDTDGIKEDEAASSNDTNVAAPSSDEKDAEEAKDATVEGQEGNNVEGETMNSGNISKLNKHQRRNLKRKLARKLKTDNPKKMKRDSGTPKTNEQIDANKPQKEKSSKEHKKKKLENNPTKIMVNGVEVEVVKYDGFPIKKEDAIRLQQLKKTMVMKGIPEKDISIAMKLERRKAEKALTRLKKNVCFHCRKPGHVLSDCSKLIAEQSSGTGICFKCGSTEHTHFQCKVVKTMEFRYAKCFICREQGHVAKQCPDNPRGVYPQGGACKVCGDVTHLKKDCPDLATKKAETTLMVDTIEGSGLESLEKGTAEKAVNKEEKSTKQKVVRF